MIEDEDVDAKRLIQSGKTAYTGKYVKYVVPHPSVFIKYLC